MSVYKRFGVRFYKRMLMIENLWPHKVLKSIHQEAYDSMPMAQGIGKDQCSGFDITIFILVQCNLFQNIKANPSRISVSISWPVADLPREIQCYFQ